MAGAHLSREAKLASTAHTAAIQLASSTTPEGKAPVVHNTIHQQTAYIACSTPETLPITTSLRWTRNSRQPSIPAPGTFASEAILGEDRPIAGSCVRLAHVENVETVTDECQMPQNRSYSERNATACRTLGRHENLQSLHVVRRAVQVLRRGKLASRHRTEVSPVGRSRLGENDKVMLDSFEGSSILTGAE